MTPQCQTDLEPTTRSMRSELFLNKGNPESSFVKEISNISTLVEINCRDHYTTASKNS